MTNNTAWGVWNDLYVPRFYYPRISSTGDNNFMLAWQRGHQESTGSVDDIYYAVRDTNGSEIKPVTKFTSDTPGSYQYYSYPTLAQLSNNHTLIAWNTAYAILDSSGNVVRPAITLNKSVLMPDAVQLSDGSILFAWSSWEQTNYQITFVILDGTTYNVVAGPTSLTNQAAVTGDGYISVTADGAGHAILTWMDNDWFYHRNLYYALVDGSGNILTDPMIFRTSLATNPRIETSYEGYGNTSYSWTLPSDVDGIAAFNRTLSFGPPGANAALSLHYANHGATTASSVVLTATLDSNLTYVSDNSGVVPMVGSTDVVWDLLDLGFLDRRDFTFNVQVPTRAIKGTRYPVKLTLTSDGLEANAGDNTDSSEVVAAWQVFLPIVFRDN